MVAMAVEVLGFDSCRETALEQAGARACSFLGHDGDLLVKIQTWPPMPMATVARSQGGEIRFNALNQKDDPFRLQIILYEEVAHLVATLRGLPEGRGTASFLQELFGLYVMLSMIKEFHARQFSKLTFRPIDPRGGGLGYTLGSHLGAELAGSAISRTQLDDWLRVNPRDYGASLVGEMRDLLADANGQADLLDRLLAYWEALDAPTDF